MADSPVQSEGPVRSQVPSSHRSGPVRAADSRLRSGLADRRPAAAGRVPGPCRRQPPGLEPGGVLRAGAALAAAGRDFIVVASGLVEIGLGLGLLLLRRRRVALGWIVAAFFVAGLPGQHLAVRHGHRLVRAQFGPEPRDPPAVPAAPGGVGPLVHGRLAGVAGVPESPPNRQVTSRAGRTPDEHGTDKTRAPASHGPAKQRRPCSVSRTSSVELRGLEPLTPCMPCRCATSCATAPKLPGNLSCEGPSSLKQPVYLKPHFPFTRIGTPSRG